MFTEANINYREIHEKGSGDVVSAFCYTIYTALKQLRRHILIPFREFPCIRGIISDRFKLLDVEHLPDPPDVGTGTWGKGPRFLGATAPPPPPVFLGATAPPRPLRPRSQ